MNIREIQNKIENLARQKGILEKQLTDAIVEAIRAVAKENPNPPRKISQHMCIIHFSDLIGNPWNIEFYDWEIAAEFVIDFLSNKPSNKWKSLLEAELKRAVRNSVPFKRNVVTKGYYVSYSSQISTPINRKFIEKIIERI